MRRKLWPKAPAKEGALGRMSKNFQVYFKYINLLKKPNKKKCTIRLRAKKKMETEKWPKAADSPLLVVAYNATP